MFEVHAKHLNFQSDEDTPTDTKYYLKQLLLCGDYILYYFLSSFYVSIHGNFINLKGNIIQYLAEYWIV